jgi:carbon storage regulator
MLVLTRAAGESVVIADNVVVRVLGSSSGKVRIGIEAPAEVSIHREETIAKGSGRNRTDLRDDDAEQH